MYLFKSRHLILVLIAFALFLIVLIELQASKTRHVSKFNSLPLRNALVKGLLEQDHIFVSANDPRLHYVGRWIPTANRLRRDASFPGAYLDFTISNTSSLYLQLRNAKASRPPTGDDKREIGPRQLLVQPRNPQKPPSTPVSLLVEIRNDRALLFDGNGHGMLSILQDDAPGPGTSIRVTVLGARDNAASVELEGVWLNKGGRLQPVGASSTIDSSPVTRPIAPQGLVEVVRPAAAASTAETAQAYPSLLATTLNSSSHRLTLPYCLTSTCNSPTINDIYFRSGPPSTPHYPLPYHFPTPPPSLLLLELGLADYQHLLATSPSPHAITQFNHKFIDAYVSFIKTVRAYAYPYHAQPSGPRSLLQQDGGLQLGMSLDYAASFTYNSAPSTLPIFILTPFTPDKRLRRVLSHVLSEAASRLQKDGDKSTFWLDTSNWLQREHFMPADIAGGNNFTVPELTVEAHRIIATYLSLHLCPYAVEKGGEGECPFNRFDNYLGHLYVPSEAGVGKMLEERKIRLIRDAVGLSEERQ